MLEAATFIIRADAGRSKPPLISASSSNSPIEVFVKFPRLHSLLTDRKLVCEWVAARLAQNLGLPVAIPHPVKLSPSFIRTLPADLRQILGAEECIGFGSEKVGNQWHVWHEGAALPLTSLPLQLSIYVFDTLIQNWDRSLDNPNLLKNGDEIVMLDHEESFQPWVEPLEDRHPKPFPWSAGGISNFYAGGTQHVFWSVLKRHRKKLDIDAALLPWKALSMGDITRYGLEASAWWNDDAAGQIVDYIGQVTGNVDAFGRCLKQALENG
jgi:hypothetical protein